jgi:rieske iron-sulfur protein
MRFFSASRRTLCVFRTTSRGNSISTPSRTLSPDRRTLLKATLGLGLVFRRFSVAAADDPKIARPQSGDRFVFAFGDRAGQIIKPDDLPLGGPQQLAYPMDPETKVMRDGSLFNQVALVRLDPAQLSADTIEFAADGVVAYSAICTHQGCPVSMWKADAKALFCSCHAAQFDPKDRARVINGPAPRRLPVLPLRVVDGVLIAAGGFVGTVGGQTH